jgi:hypothetical protein
MNECGMGFPSAKPVSCMSVLFMPAVIKGLQGTHVKPVQSQDTGALILLLAHASKFNTICGILHSLSLLLLTAMAGQLAWWCCSCMSPTSCTHIHTLDVTLVVDVEHAYVGR